MGSWVSLLLHTNQHRVERGEQPEMEDRELVLPRPAARQLLSFELTRLRVQSGVSQKEAGEHIGRTQSQIANCENGTSLITIDALPKLLKLYGRTDQLEMLSAVHAIASSRKENSTLPAGVTANSGLLFGLEQIAETMGIYEPSVVTGLLQTRDYALWVLRDLARWFEMDVEAALKLRMDRQSAVLRSAEPLKLTVFTKDSVLRGTGPDARIMLAQLEHLIEMSKLRNVVVRVIPDDRGCPPLSATELTLSDGWRLVFAETMFDAYYSSSEAKVETCDLLMAGVRKQALSQRESRKLMELRRKEHKAA